MNGGPSRSNTGSNTANTQQTQTPDLTGTANTDTRLDSNPTLTANTDTRRSAPRQQTQTPDVRPPRQRTQTPDVRPPTFGRDVRPPDVRPHDGGRAACTWYTIIESARINHVRVLPYLNDVLVRVPAIVPQYLRIVDAKTPFDALMDQQRQGAHGAAPRPLVETAPRASLRGSSARAR